MRRKSLQYILFIAIFTLAVGGVGYVWISRFLNRKGVSVVTTNPAVAQIAPVSAIPPRNDGEVKETESDTSGTLGTGGKQETPIEVAEKTRIDTSGWVVYRNDALGYQLRYPETWTLGKTGSKSVKLNRSDVQGTTSALVYVDATKERPSGVKPYDWLDSQFAVPPSLKDKYWEYVEVPGGYGWKIVSPADAHINATIYFTKTVANSPKVYEVGCTAMNAMATWRITLECFEVMRSFAFTE